MRVVLVAGGTGAAKLAAGLREALDPDGLTAVVNTGDDEGADGLRVCHDADEVGRWLAGLGRDDPAVARSREVRSAALRGGGRLTEAQVAADRALGHGVDVLPMSDDDAPVRVQGADGAWRDFGDALRAPRGEAWPPQALVLADVPATREVLAALDDADRVVLGPSNPAISIGPVLACRGVRARLARPRVVAVSPFVGGRSLEPEADDFVRAAGLTPGDDALREAYAPQLDAVVTKDLLMRSAQDRLRLARHALAA